MYIKDGSQEDYSSKDIIPNRYSWGWLGDCVPKGSRGWTDYDLKVQVLDKIGAMKKKHTVLQHMGCHDCEICLSLHKQDICDGNGSYLITWNGIEYRCPEMVDHYIQEHDYFPGLQVVEAILKGRWYSRDEEKNQWRVKDRTKDIQEEREREREAAERDRLSKMTPEQIAAEESYKKMLAEREKVVAAKIAQLRANGAFVD